MNTIRSPVDERSFFLGRNGCCHCTGVGIFAMDDFIEFQPWTSKNRPGRCYFRMPVASLPELLEILSRITTTAIGRRSGKKKRRQPPSSSVTHLYVSPEVSTR